MKFSQQEIQLLVTEIIQNAFPAAQVNARERFQGTLLFQKQPAENWHAGSRTCARSVILICSTSFLGRFFHFSREQAEKIRRTFLQIQADERISAFVHSVCKVIKFPRSTEFSFQWARMQNIFL